MSKFGLRSMRVAGVIRCVSGIKRMADDFGAPLGEDTEVPVRVTDYAVRIGEVREELSGPRPRPGTKDVVAVGLRCGREEGLGTGPRTSEEIAGPVVLQGRVVIPVAHGGQHVRIAFILKQIELAAAGKSPDSRSRLVENRQEGIDAVGMQRHANEADEHGGRRD